jgi:hypothetical protein
MYGPPISEYQTYHASHDADIGVHLTRYRSQCHDWVRYWLSLSLLWPARSDLKPSRRDRNPDDGTLLGGHCPRHWHTLYAHCMSVWPCNRMYSVRTVILASVGTGQYILHPSQQIKLRRDYTRLRRNNVT